MQKVSSLFSVNPISKVGPARSATILAVKIAHSVRLVLCITQDLKKSIGNRINENTIIRAYVIGVFIVGSFK